MEQYDKSHRAFGISLWETDFLFFAKMLNEKACECVGKPKKSAERKFRSKYHEKASKKKKRETSNILRDIDSNFYKRRLVSDMFLP